MEEQVNQRRIHYLLEQTQAVRKRKASSALILDDTLCKHVGSLFDYVARHYDQSENSYPLAHNLVTSHYVSGPVRFPVGLRMYRRYEELTRWEQFVHKHFPEREIPSRKKERNLDTNSFVLKDAAGQAIKLEGPHMAVQDLVALIPTTAYRQVKVGEKRYWAFTLSVRIPSLGKVRIVISV